MNNSLRAVGCGLFGSSDECMRARAQSQMTQADGGEGLFFRLPFGNMLQRMEIPMLIWALLEGIKDSQWCAAYLIRGRTNRHHRNGSCSSS